MSEGYGVFGGLFEEMGDMDSEKKDGTKDSIVRWLEAKSARTYWALNLRYMGKSHLMDLFRSEERRGVVYSIVNDVFGSG